MAFALGPADEIRPGNFVFYDAQQLGMGVCQLKDIAAVVACPVVARYPERREVVIYGGAVHLSKDTVKIDGKNWFGLVGVVNEAAEGSSELSWLTLVRGGYVTKLSQEHGVVTLPESAFNQVEVGSLLYVIPAHVCLTVSALGEYTTTAGQAILTMNKEV
jgi:D-serine deaminase-like pyridoxal phosphate-dependent protein